MIDGSGVLTPPPLSGPTTKKNTFFICVFPITQTFGFKNIEIYDILLSDDS